MAIQTAVPFPEPGTLGESFDSNNSVVLISRNLPTAGSGNWKTFYDNLEESAGTIVIDNNVPDGHVSGETSVAQVRFGNSPAAIVVKGLLGCFALLCYSGNGTCQIH
jgi:hypothetical protein